MKKHSSLEMTGARYVPPSAASRLNNERPENPEYSLPHSLRYREPKPERIPGHGMTGRELILQNQLKQQENAYEAAEMTYFLNSVKDYSKQQSVEDRFLKQSEKALGLALNSQFRAETGRQTADDDIVLRNLGLLNEGDETLLLGFADGPLQADQPTNIFPPDDKDDYIVICERYSPDAGVEVEERSTIFLNRPEDLQANEIEGFAPPEQVGSSNIAGFSTPPRRAVSGVDAELLNSALLGFNFSDLGDM